MIFFFLKKLLTFLSVFTLYQTRQFACACSHYFCAVTFHTILNTNDLGHGNWPVVILVPTIHMMCNRMTET